MNKLDAKKRGQILAALCEGNSIRAVTRMLGMSKNTIAKLLIEAGAACAEYQDKALRNLRSKRIQCDEIWSFARNRPTIISATPASADSNNNLYPSSL